MSSLAMNKNVGFTLIEVLVAVTIMAVGLLGLAGLQASGIKFNQSAYHRSQATNLAYDLADRIRANSSAAATYINIDGGNMDYLQSPLPIGTAKPNCKLIAGCTPQQMAETDINQWRADIFAALPSGCGSVMVGAVGAATKNGCGGTIPAAVAASPDVYTITINWDDNKDGKVDGSDPNFMMSFQL
ncbi:MAG: type IV pilus modification protein PilV [Methyloglobulus sp.]